MSYFVPIPQKRVRFEVGLGNPYRFVGSFSKGQIIRFFVIIMVFIHNIQCRLIISGGVVICPDSIVFGISIKSVDFIIIAYILTVNCKFQKISLGAFHIVPQQVVFLQP